jgi:hypothetical protein
MKQMNAIEKEDVNVIDSLIAVFEELRKNKDHQKEIDEQLSMLYKIPRGTINELLIDMSKLEQLSQDELIVLCVVAHRVIKDERANPFNYYSQKAVSKALKYRGETEEVIELPYTFNDYYVIQTTESDYLTAMKYKSISAIWNNQILEYNTSLQRKPKEKINKKGVLVKTPKVIAKSVKEITDLMARKKFRSNTITFCILRDGTEEVVYDEGELTVISGKIFIIDGYHRLSGILNTLESDPDNNDSMDVAIKYLTNEEAEQYLGQINKMSKFDKSFVNYLMNDKLEDKIVKEVEIKSALLNRVSKEASVSKKSLNLTSFNVLSNGVRDIFAPKDGKDRIDVSEVLINFFDYLIAYYPNDFSKDLKTLVAARDSSLRNYHNTFVIYLVIAKALFDKHGKRIPSDEIIRLVESFDYSKDGEYAKVLFGEGTGKVNSDQVKRKIREYAKNKVAEIL